MSSVERGLRFAVQLRDAASGPEWVELARRMESIGYDAISMPDHLWPQFAPLPGLAAIATATERVRLTMAVLANDFRNPVILAKEAATLDVLSGGRLDLGLGAGWREEEYRHAGFRFDRAGLRIERLAEAVTIIKRLLEGGSLTFHGAFYDVDGYELSPRPTQRPRPRIMLGGGAPRMLSLAAREAEIVSITTDNRNRTGLEHGGAGRFDEVRRAVDVVRQAAGSRFGSIELNARVLLADVGDDRDAVAARHADRFGLPPAELAASPFCAVGTVAQVSDHFRRLRDELALSFFTVSAAQAEQLAPVVTALTGT